MSEIRAPKSFCDVKGFGSRMALHSVQPGLVIKTRRLDHQSVAVPFRRRVAQPGGKGVIPQFPAVHEDLTKEIHLLVKNHDEFGSLDDLERKKTICVDPRNSVRQTSCQRIIAVIAG